PAAQGGRPAVGPHQVHGGGPQRQPRVRRRPPAAEEGPGRDGLPRGRLVHRALPALLYPKPGRADPEVTLHRSHLSHRALIWSANLARSLLAPPSLCSMTRIRRRPADTSRWNTACARLSVGVEALDAARSRLPSFRQTAPSAPSAHWAPL